MAGRYAGAINRLTVTMRIEGLHADTRVSVGKKLKGCAMMQRVIATFIAGFLFATAPAALGCRYSPPPFEPLRDDYSVALIGEVTNEVGNTGSVFADLKISKVVWGQYSPKTYRLNWYVYDGRGMCPPRGPHLAKGQVVKVYLAERPANPGSPASTPNSQNSFYPKGWLIVKSR